MDLALEYLARYLSDYPYLGLFLILSVGAFGFPIPEEIVLVAAGLFVDQGTIELAPTLLVCGVGQIIGDLLLFGVGRRYGTGAFRGILGRLLPRERIEKVDERLQRYGLLVVFFGRYLTGVRPAVFLAAGAARIPVRRFLLVDGASAIISLVIWVSVGWAFSGWIETVLRVVRAAEGQLLAGLGAIVAVLLLEKALVRLGRLKTGSRAVRVMSHVRIPLLVVTVVFAVLIAREHHIGKRNRLVLQASSGSPSVVTDLGLLIEALPRLAPAERPIEVVFVGTRPLLEEAVREAGYEAKRGGGLPPDVYPFSRDPDCYFERASTQKGMAFWRSSLIYRSQPVWFGQFEGTMSRAELHDLSKSLTSTHYALRTVEGPRLHPGAPARVFVAVLRHPTIR